MYAYWVCAARETPILSPKFPFRGISFSQKSAPEHHHFTFFADFAVPEKISLISTRSSPPTAGSSPNTKRSAAPRVSGRPERQPDASWQFRRLAFSRSKPYQARSAAPHFHAQNGSSSIRSPEFSRSTGSSFRSPAGAIFHFAAAHTYQNLG